MEPIRMARVIRKGEDDGLFDLEFWQRQTSQARMNAAWEMVKLYLRTRGITDEPRLNRSVAVLKRRER